MGDDVAPGRPSTAQASALISLQGSASLSPIGLYQFKALLVPELHC